MTCSRSWMSNAAAPCSKRSAAGSRSSSPRRTPIASAKGCPPWRKPSACMRAQWPYRRFECGTVTLSQRRPRSRLLSWHTRQSLFQTRDAMKLLSGLIAGAIAAVVASLVSLPLDAPDDLVFNTGTVTIAALAVGLAAELLWLVVERRSSGRQIYVVGVAGGFVVPIILAVVGEQYFDGAL